MIYRHNQVRNKSNPYFIKFLLSDLTAFGTCYYGDLFLRMKKRYLIKIFSQKRLILPRIVPIDCFHCETRVPKRYAPLHSSQFFEPPLATWVFLLQTMR